MRYSLLAGGKRIRPVLALATAEALGREPDEVLPLAAAIEMIHTYSLIHDDLPAMDDDDLRRGQPTCHVAFGEDVAILAGDGLFAEALRLVLTEQEGEPAHVLAAVRELMRAAGVGGMVGGQFLDVTAAGDLDAAGLRRLHELKTGRLIAASVGCVLTSAVRADLPQFPRPLRSGARRVVPDRRRHTRRHWRRGRAGQAAVARTSATGSSTYVSVFGLERARELAGESHAEARAALAGRGTGPRRLEQIADYILTRQT